MTLANANPIAWEASGLARADDCAFDRGRTWGRGAYRVWHPGIIFKGGERDLPSWKVIGLLCCWMVAGISIRATRGGAGFAMLSDIAVMQLVCVVQRRIGSGRSVLLSQSMLACLARVASF